MKMFRILLLGLLAMLCSIVVAADLCTERSITDCTLVTPNISCSGDYTIYNALDGAVAQTGSMTNIAEGMYNFTIGVAEGSYTIILCSGHQTDIEIISSDEEVATVGDLTNTTINANSTAIATAVWDFNLTSRYSAAEDDNFIATLAGQKVVQALRFMIQLLFGGN